MANCINKNHPDFLKLEKESGLDGIVLAAKMGVWMDKNNSEEWPTLEQLGIEGKSNIKPGVSELFESNFSIFEEATSAEEVISKLLSNKIIEKKCD